eukprot:scaffold86304_cov58-Phaeocystis_antarctica.AAC.7
MVSGRAPVRVSTCYTVELCGVLMLCQPGPSIPEACGPSGGEGTVKSVSSIYSRRKALANKGRRRLAQRLP